MDTSTIVIIAAVVVVLYLHAHHGAPSVSVASPAVSVPRPPALNTYDPAAHLDAVGKAAYAKFQGTW